MTDIKLPPLPGGNVAHLISVQAAEIGFLKDDAGMRKESK